MKKNLSPNLSPTRREALKPPFPAPGRGAGGLGQSVNLKLYNVFRRYLFRIAIYSRVLKDCYEYIRVFA